MTFAGGRQPCGCLGRSLLEWEHYVKGWVGSGTYKGAWSRINKRVASRPGKDSALLSGMPCTPSHFSHV